MSWQEHSIFWHVYPLGFVGAPLELLDQNPVNRLEKLEFWLDYALELGCSGLLLGPIFASDAHGYDTLDHYRIDPRLGTLDDFDHFVAECKRRGLRIVLDGVFNHVSRKHPAFQNVLRDGEGSADVPLFRIHGWENGQPRYDNFEGHDHLPALNHAEPRVHRWVADVMKFWLDRGVDGWRLDVAYAVDTAFWHAVIGEVRAQHPDAWFLGEMIHGDYAGFVRDSGVDSVTQYELWKAIWSGLSDRNFFELDWAMQRHNEFCDAFRPQTFIGNHDVNRIATTLDDDFLVGVAATILFTVGGIPSVYYGDEQGYRGTKYERLGGDDEIRPSFPDDPSQLSALGERLHRLHQGLISMRRRHPWLVDARTRQVALSNERLVYLAEVPGQQLQVELDLADRTIVLREGGVEVFRWS